MDFIDACGTTLPEFTLSEESLSLLNELDRKTQGSLCLVCEPFSSTRFYMEPNIKMSDGSPLIVCEPNPDACVQALADAVHKKEKAGFTVQTQPHINFFCTEYRNIQPSAFDGHACLMCRIRSHRPKLHL